ncbi:uncharacterized protein EMH_0059420 [Eimeria mitis]|uniref:Uncharacterized protein n=1 Tax=Eimeria mitis TaxID=44415 RepID=U6K489_9EIME|nr:uncharacterized protein EMH_0059420 [Eimeria mitis]CDJ30568.1 hypothetical protein EMH_0059420 [Eimeria mitis]
MPYTCNLQENPEFFFSHGLAENDFSNRTRLVVLVDAPSVRVDDARDADERTCACTHLVDGATILDGELLRPSERSLSTKLREAAIATEGTRSVGFDANDRSTVSGGYITRVLGTERTMGSGMRSAAALESCEPILLHI